MRTLWASCIALWISCTPVYATDFKPLTRDEVVVRVVLQESNGEPFPGMVTVAGTVFDRAMDSRWPDTVRGVAYQPRQYSGMSIRIKPYTRSEVQRARDAVLVARAGYRPCGDVYWFHTPDVSPAWAKKLSVACVIGNHIFYTDKE